MNYTDITTEWALLTNIPVDDANFVSNLPSTIAYAEERIVRELDLKSANITDGTASTTANNREFTLPTTYGTFLVVNNVNIITPAATAPNSGTRNPLTPVSQAVLDFTWGSSTGAGVPTEYAWVTQDTTTASQPQIILGPWPDAAYRVEVVGKVQPAALSASNPTTWLSINLPSLYIAAGMVWLTGYQRNWSGSSDDPQMAVNWLKTYEQLRDSAMVWQARARFAGASWTSNQPEPVAINQRG